MVLVSFTKVTECLLVRARFILTAIWLQILGLRHSPTPRKGVMLSSGGQAAHTRHNGKTDKRRDEEEFPGLRG